VPLSNQLINRGIVFKYTYKGINGLYH